MSSSLFLVPPPPLRGRVGEGGSREIFVEENRALVSQRSPPRRRHDLLNDLAPFAVYTRWPIRPTKSTPTRTDPQEGRAR